MHVDREHPGADVEHARSTVARASLPRGRFGHDRCSRRPHAICHNDQRHVRGFDRTRAPPSRDGAATGLRRWRRSPPRSRPALCSALHLALLLFFLNPGLDLEATTVAARRSRARPRARSRARRSARARAARPAGAAAVRAALGHHRRAGAGRRRAVGPRRAVRLLPAAGHQRAPAQGRDRREPPHRALLLHRAAALDAATPLRLAQPQRRSRCSRCSRSLLTAERRCAFPRPPSPPLELGMRARPAQTNLAVVALEGATLDAILPLAEQGQLPFLSTLLAAGRLRRLKTLAPPMRVAVWRSVATGAYPFRHGVVSDRTYAAPVPAPTPTPAGSQLALVPWGSGFARWARPLGVRTERPAAAARARPRCGRSSTAPGSRPRRGLAGTATRPTRRAGPSACRSRSSTLPTWAARRPTRARGAERLRPSLRTLDPTVFAPLGDAVPERVKTALVEDLWRDAVARDLLARSRGRRAERALRRAARVCSRCRATRSAATPRSTSTATRERCSAKRRSS